MFGLSKVNVAYLFCDTSRLYGKLSTRITVYFPCYLTAMFGPANGGTNIGGMWTLGVNWRL